VDNAASSYYPGRGDNTHPLSRIDPDDHDTDSDDLVIETEEDWMDDEHMVKLTQGPPSKFSEAIAREVSI
jgi:hypothetical protein